MRTGESDSFDFKHFNVSEKRAEACFALITENIIECQNKLIAKKDKANAKAFLKADIKRQVDSMLGAMGLGDLEFYKYLNTKFSSSPLSKEANKLEKEIKEFDKSIEDAFTMLETFVEKERGAAKSSQRKQVIVGVLVAVASVVIACLTFNEKTAATFANLASNVMGPNPKESLIAAMPADFEAALQVAKSIGGVVGGLAGLLLGSIISHSVKSEAQIDLENFAKVEALCRENSKTVLKAVAEFVRTPLVEGPEKETTEFVDSLKEQSKDVDGRGGVTI